MSLSPSEVEILQNAHVLKLQSAARMAGLRFKNGALSKRDIIDRLMALPSVARATIAGLGKEYPAPAPTPPIPAPSKRAPWEYQQKSDPIGWEDDEVVPVETPAKSAPTPSPTETPSLPLSEFALKRDLEALALKTESSFKTVALHIDSAATAIKSQASRIEALEKARPVSFTLQPKAEEIRPEGLTHEKLPLLIQILAAGENAFLKGPAGSGKTTAAKQAGAVLAKLFSREDYQVLATGAVNDEFKLLGFKDATGVYQRTAFRDAYEYGHLFLWDEVDASSSDSVLVINSLDNGFVMFPDRKVDAHPHFRLIAGGNTDGSGATMEYSGRNRMDGAFRDRFAIIDWPLDPRIEAHLSNGNPDWLSAVRAIRDFATKREILDVVATARAVRRGPAFLHQGMPREAVLETTCKRGALIEAWPDVLRLPAVQTFLRG